MVSRGHGLAERKSLDVKRIVDEAAPVCQ